MYETNLFKIKIQEQENFGTLTDTDNHQYEAYEIHFHTPGEHQQNGL